MAGWKRTESGRSMVEILGILAIVAVLTIGGILGYGYAVGYYRENETLDAYNKTAAGALTGRIMENYGPEAEAGEPVSVPVSEVISGVDRVSDYVFRTAVGARVEVEVNNSQSFSIHAKGMRYGACRKLVMARDLGYTYAYVDDGGAHFGSALANPDIAGAFCDSVDPERVPAGEGGPDTDFVLCFGACDIDCGGECAPCYQFVDKGGTCSCVPIPDCTCDAARDCTPCEQCDDAGQCVPDPTKVGDACSPFRCCAEDSTCTATCACAVTCGPCQKCSAGGGSCEPDPAKNGFYCSVCKRCNNGQCQYIPNCTTACTPADGPCCGSPDPACCGNPNPCACNPSGACCLNPTSCACQPNSGDCARECATSTDPCCGSTDQQCCGDPNPCACNPSGACCLNPTGCACQPNNLCCESDDPCCENPAACSDCTASGGTPVPVQSGDCCEITDLCCSTGPGMCTSVCTPADSCSGGRCPDGRKLTWVP
ncbi:MAG: hypothetical protein PHX68_03705 [Alphaproteobacteria bacterium]|nr:hypothetical protein [Alphaproteobacteria bacterium]